MPIDRVITFRFNREPLVCRARVDLLRRWNPQIAVHGSSAARRATVAPRSG